MCWHHPVSLSDPVPAVIVCTLAGNICKRVDQAFACEGADENSCQSRPRDAVVSPTPGRLPPPRETAADLARVMLLLDVSTIARNVGRHLVFAASRRAEHSHSDLGDCAEGVADALPARQTARLCSWHACASVWIATSFRPCLACISMQTPGGRCICKRSCLTRAKHSWRACMACTRAEALPVDMSKALTAQ